MSIFYHATKQPEDAERTRTCSSRPKIAFISGASSACTKNILLENNFVLRFCNQPKHFRVGWGNPKPVRFYRNMPAGSFYFQIPGSSIFGRKDYLALLLRDTDFHPLTFVLPREANQARKLASRGVCLYKPALNARGNGIRLLCKQASFNVKNAAVVYKYCSSLLLDGYKFDLRMYVLVTSVDPLTVYLYDDGIARFATVRHANLAENRAERRMFLTNYAVNRAQRSGSGGPESAEGIEYKRSIAEVFAHLNAHSELFAYPMPSAPSELLLAQIRAIVKEVFLRAETHLVYQGYVGKTAYAIPRRCAALYGADFIVLQTGVVQLLEMNVCPSSGTSTTLDKDLKYPMHRTMFGMMGVLSESSTEGQEQLRVEFSQCTAQYIDLQRLTRYEKAVIRSAANEMRCRGRFQRILPSITGSARYLSRLVVAAEAELAARYDIAGEKGVLCTAVLQ